MLKNIRLHLATQDSEQEELEQKLAAKMDITQRENLNSLQRFMPSLVPYIKELKTTNISVFCNKFGQTNLVDYSQGRVFYGEKPEQEIQKQIDNFVQHPLLIEFNAECEQDNETAPLEAFNNKLASIESYASLPNDLDCLVVLGCGLGQHIHYLVNHYNIKHLIIYEPEVQYLKCSVLTMSWKQLFEIAKEKGTNIYFQVLKDGRDLIKDIDELRQLFEVSGFFLYKHYNHEIFDKIAVQLTQNSWERLVRQGFSFLARDAIVNYLPQWTFPLSHGRYKLIEDSKIYRTNLTIFKGFFPGVHKQMEDFKPTYWFPVELANGEISAIHRDNLASWYSDSPREDCQKNYNLFSEQPHKDGLILGYNGKKLSHYQHYKFVAKSEALLNEVKEDEGALPKKIQSIILFGLGVGYQLEELFDNHEIEHIFICEPNIDFFHASLFAIDWKRILKKIAKRETRIYLNIGDDGSNLMKDLLNQFYSIGPYILNNTFFYQCYYNAKLNAALAQLREQLKIVISIGEYFDHAYYGIMQTVTTVEEGYSLLRSKSAELLSYEDKATPIFIVGNGPSLDNSIAILKEESERAIIVSCGTALKVLYKHGIVPDFHAEIEQNRTTYDWATLVGDPEYLKQINLISCNGIHPDTCKLYKEVLIVFKEGESSTISTLEILGEDNYEILDYAFPTVANFAINLFTRLSFEALYLIGVDLGFVDNKYHHSKDSGYYLEDGKELYDYAQQNNTSIQTPGNFRKTVSTKLEFKIAKQVIESSIQKSGRKNYVYNCSDGARIAGALPLYLDNVLLVSDPDQKQKTLKTLLQKAFYKPDIDKFKADYLKKYNPHKLRSELLKFEQHLDTKVSSKEEASHFIDTQKEILFDSYKNGESLLFYFLFGTVNFANAALIKLLYASTSEQDSVKYFNQEKALWEDCLTQLKSKILSEHRIFDASEFNRHVRVACKHQDIIRDKKILVVTNSKAFSESIMFFVKNRYGWKATILIAEIDTPSLATTQVFDYVIYHEHREVGKSQFYQNLSRNLMNCTKGKSGTLVIMPDIPGKEYKEVLSKNLELSVLVYRQDDKKPEEKYWTQDQFNLAFEAMSGIIEATKYDIIIPKLIHITDIETRKLEKLLSIDISPFKQVLEFKRTITLNFSSEKPITDVQVMSNGDRGAIVKKLCFPESYIIRNRSRENYLDVYQKICENIPSLPLNSSLSSFDVEQYNQ